MAGFHRVDAEIAIIMKRAELNDVLRHRSNYDVEGHNICLALVKFKDGSSDILSAYSNDSAIPESVRLGMNLIPDLYDHLPIHDRYGCDGMAQHHTEPKLLNYLCASPGIRESVLSSWQPQDETYRSMLNEQRRQTRGCAQGLKRIEDVVALTLVTEINCCGSCTNHSINLFKARFPHVDFEVIQLGKKTKGNIPPQFKEAIITQK